MHRPLGRVLMRLWPAEIGEDAVAHVLGDLNEELALLLAIGGPLMANKGFAAPEVERTYSRASALCDQMTDPPSCFRC